VTSTVERGTGRPKSGYFASDGGRVPSTTTISGRFKDPGGLYYGHWRNGAEGRDYNDWGSDALAIGNQVHRMFESFLHGEDVEKPDSLEAIGAFEAARDWWEGSRLTVEATEIPLVSEAHRFGGTIDGILRDSKGRLCIGDWKTSAGIYGDYLLQIAAYGLLWNEHNAEQITGGFHLVRFSKENGDLEHRHFSHLDEAAEMFLLLREAYELDKAVKKRAR
jgi:hypothetical protein